MPIATILRLKTFVPHLNVAAAVDRRDRRTDTVPRSTQPCIPPGSLNRVPASAGLRAGMSPLPGGG